MRVPITKKGFEQLRDELDRLKKVERPKVIRDIAEARAHGDLSENAEYHAARERQSFIEGRIKELQGKMGYLEVIEPTSGSSEKIVFGATVQLLDSGSERNVTFTIVGEDEADANRGRISVRSPLARALI